MKVHWKFILIWLVFYFVIFGYKIFFPTSIEERIKAILGLIIYTPLGYFGYASIMKHHSRDKNKTPK